MSDEMTKIVNLTPGIKGLNIKCIILEISSPTITKSKQEVRCVKVADETGSVNMSVWDYLGRTLVPGDILRMEGGYSAMWKMHLTVYLGRKATLYQLPRNDSLSMCYTVTPYMSKTNPAFEDMFRGKRRNWSRRHYNVVAIAPAASLFPPAPIRPLIDEYSSSFDRAGRSADPPVPTQPSPPPENRRPQITVSSISRPMAIAAASVVVAPIGRPSTSEAPPATAVPLTFAEAALTPEPAPEPLVDYYRPHRHGRGH